MSQFYLKKYQDYTLIGCVFLVFLYFIVIRPLGYDLSFVPGDLGDSRFNMYVLEHFYRYIGGVQKDFWSAPFFYPFPYTMAFSENHIGTGIIYSFFRRTRRVHGQHSVSHSEQFVAARASGITVSKQSDDSAHTIRRPSS